MSGIKAFPLIGLCFVLGFSSQTLYAQEMILVYAESYQPYSWKSDEGKIQGVEVDFVSEILANKMGISIRHEIYPWARAQSLVRQGHADAFVTIPNDSRREYSQESDTPFFISNFLIYTGMSNPKKAMLQQIKTLPELIKRPELIHGQILGAGWHISHLKEAKNVQKFSTSLQILQMLDKNRIDVYIEQAPLILYQIKELDFDGRISEIDNVMDKTNWHICIGKKSSYFKILPKLNALLASMESDGSLQRLRKKIFKKYQ